ncbi:hypothetical protein D3C76_1626020 [compost metagenome]
MGDVHRRTFRRCSEAGTLSQSVTLGVDGADAGVVDLIASDILTMHITGNRSVVAGCDDGFVFDDDSTDRQLIAGGSCRRQSCNTHEVFIP